MAEPGGFRFFTRVSLRGHRGETAAHDGGFSAVPSTFTILTQFLHSLVEQSHAKMMAVHLFQHPIDSTAGTKDSKKVLDFSIRQVQTMAILQLI